MFFKLIHEICSDVNLKIKNITKIKIIKKKSKSNNITLFNIKFIFRESIKSFKRYLRKLNDKKYILKKLILIIVKLIQRKTNFRKIRSKIIKISLEFNNKILSDKNL